MSNPATSAPAPPVNRRDRFRRYIHAFNPTQPALAAIKADLVAKSLHGNLFERIAVRAELQPDSQQLLIGGIGSGKTTELLLAHRALEAKAGMLPIYIDITTETDLSRLQSAALLASFGLHLLRRGPAINRTDALAIEHFALARSVWVSDEEGGEGEETPGTIVKVPGKLFPPNPPLDRDLKDFAQSLGNVVSKLDGNPNLVVQFDGLDRLIDPKDFWAVTQQDLQVFKDLKIPVILAAPLTLLYDGGRSVTDHFDPVHTMFDVTVEGDGIESLRALVGQRDPGHMLAPECIDELCRYSGGVLRDLMTLARDAGEAAYMSPQETISTDNVKTAAHRLGVSYLRGLGPEQLKILDRIGKSGSFRTGQPAEIELLATRRVLEYSETKFAAHPALTLARGEAQHG